MRFLTSKILWLTIYAIGVTCVFLYILFPSPLAKQQLETAANSAGFVLQAESLHPSLPLGIKLKDLTVHGSQMPTDVFFQGELLDLQFNPLSVFQKHKTIHFKGKAYSGNFDGQASFLSFPQTNLPAEGRINFQNIELAKYNSDSLSLFKGMTGHARGSAFYVMDDATSKNPVGKLSLYLSQGAYPLPEPFLGLSRIVFDRGEVQVQLKNGSVTLEKLEIYGAQMNCFLNGNIQIADRLADSRLNLKGWLAITGKNRIKMNVTVGGTLASPSFRYI
jgi:type II secretion system protein N